MRTLIVLCAGNRKLSGQPFIFEKYPLDGIRLGYKAVSGIYPESYDRIIYTISAAEDMHDVRKALQSAVPSSLPVEVWSLGKTTSGPAESAYETIMGCCVEGEVHIRDSHNYILLSKPATGNCIAGLDLTKHDESIEELRRKSFLILNEQRQILDIMEKSFRSDVISVGLYGFRASEDFVSAYERLTDPVYPINKIYISHVISYLIGYKNKVFKECAAEEYEDWGSSIAWQKLNGKFATYFVDAGLLLEQDGSGYLKELMRRKRLGARVMICLNGYDNDVIAIKTALQSRGILYDGIVEGCTVSKEKRFIGSWESL